SIPSLPRTGGPFCECRPRIVRHQPDVWNPSQTRLQSDLTVNELVVEADVCRLGPRVGVVDAPQPRPIDCAEAHRAGLAARVDVAVRQVERAQQRAGTANGHNLGMRGRVVVGRDLVPAFRDDCVVADDDCAEWSAAVRAHFLKRKRDRALHKCLFAHQPIASSNGGMVYSSLNWRWSSHHRWHCRCVAARGARAAQALWDNASVGVTQRKVGPSVMVSAWPDPPSARPAEPSAGVCDGREVFALPARFLGALCGVPTQCNSLCKPLVLLAAMALWAE